MNNCFCNNCLDGFYDMCQRKEEKTMMSKVHEILKDKECAASIKCLVWGFIIAIAVISAPITLIAYMSNAEELEDQYVEELAGLKNKYAFVDDTRTILINRIDAIENNIMPSCLKGRK